MHERKQYMCARHKESLLQSRDSEQSVTNADTQPEGNSRESFTLPSLAVEQVQVRCLRKTPNLFNRVLAA